MLCHLFIAPVSSKAVTAHLSQSLPSWNSQGDGEMEFAVPSKFLFLFECAAFVFPVQDAAEGNLQTQKLSREGTTFGLRDMLYHKLV